MKKTLTLLIAVFFFAGLSAQETDLPYKEIPEAPSKYDATTVLSRMIDGLGFRYYWATEELRPEDLLFTPGNDGRNCGETLDHILSLSSAILNAAKNTVNTRRDWSEYSWEEKRALTLMNLQEASQIFRELKPSKLEKHKVIFERDGKRSEYPIWNLMNGQLADAINHVGQIVSFRRSAGNPLPKGVNVFRGTHKHPH